MKIYIALAALLALSGCTEKAKEIKYPICLESYEENEAIKIVGQSEGETYYKHSWNDQNKVFSAPRTFASWEKIECGVNGYERKILEYKLMNLQRSIKHLEELTEPLREKGKSK